jgi:hypothetical protein
MTTKPIDAGPGYDRLAEAMDAEGIFQIRRHSRVLAFSVQMTDGRIGSGRTIREAIESAKQDTILKAVAA